MRRRTIEWALISWHEFTRPPQTEMAQSPDERSECHTEQFRTDLSRELNGTCEMFAYD